MIPPPVSALLGLALTTMLLPGCVFSPRLGDGQVHCGDGGSCPPGQACGDDAFCHVRGEDLGAGGDLSGCVAATCPPGACGQIADGCGHVIGCGDSCPPTAPVCGGGGPNRCGVSACVPLTRCGPTQTCGTISDGCAGTVTCGMCGAGQACGGDGTPNRCCTPTTMCAAGDDCGRAPDGCGGVVVCGTCPGQKVCGGNGVPNRCAGKDTTCTPKSCASQGKTCGSISDGCADVVNCGVCPSGKSCVENVCS